MNRARSAFALSSAIAALTFAAVGCSSESSENTTPVASSATEPASPTVDWPYLQTAYSKTLGQGDCADGEQAVTCHALRKSEFDTMRVDLADLPPSKERANLLKTLDMYTDGYNDLVDKGCALPGGFDVFCSTGNYTANLNAQTVKLIVDKAAKGG